MGQEARRQGVTRQEVKTQEAGRWKLEAREISPGRGEKKKASKHGGLEALLELQRWV